LEKKKNDKMKNDIDESVDKSLRIEIQIFKYSKHLKICIIFWTIVESFNDFNTLLSTFKPCDKHSFVRFSVGL